MKTFAIVLMLLSTLNFVSCNKNTTAPTPPAAPSPTKASQNIVVDTTVKNSSEALNLLREGNKRFVSDNSELVNINAERREQLKNGQHPYATIVSCSDSRVSPSLIFNAGLGEIFDVRLAGNVVDPDALGSIEYAVDHLHTPLIVVLGHQNCGAVTAAYDTVVKGTPAVGNMAAFIDQIKPSVNPKGSINDAINNNVDRVVKQIKEDPIIKNEIAAGKVEVLGAYYSFDGTVTFK